MSKGIHINYHCLGEISLDQEITPELVRKAQSLFGWRARRRLLTLLDPHLRVVAVEVAAQKVNPYILYDSGKRALLEALELYKADHHKQSFRAFADPFIRQAMQRAKEHM